MRPHLTMAALLTLAGVCTLPPSRAQAAGGGVDVGVLTCRESSGWGYMIGSSHSLFCSFSGEGRVVEHYVGHIAKFGVDIGYQRSATLVWAVFAPTGGVGRGALAGNYGGVTAGASLALGASANALIGGSGDTVSLQPLSVAGTTGLNVTAGVASMTLRYVSAVMRRPLRQG